MQAFKANSKLASSNTITALFPPNSNIVLPNLVWTVELILFPMLVEPVKLINSNLLSLINYSPTVLPGPVTIAKTPSGALFFSKTSAIILVVAKVTRDVVEAPFHKTKSPHIKAIAKFQPKTAHGKLKAVMTPINPKGFHYSIIKWSGLSEGIIFPFKDLLNPQAISQISINS